MDIELVNIEPALQKMEHTLRRLVTLKSPEMEILTLKITRHNIFQT